MGVQESGQTFLEAVFVTTLGGKGGVLGALEWSRLEGIELSSPQSMMMYWTYLMRPKLIKNGKSDADWHFLVGNIQHKRNIRHSTD